MDGVCLSPTTFDGGSPWLVRSNAVAWRICVLHQKSDIAFCNTILGNRKIEGTGETDSLFNRLWAFA